MDYVDALDRLDMSLEFKLQFALLMGNFSFGVTRLIDTLKTVHDCIVTFRQKHHKEIEQEFENILYNQKAKFYHQYFKIDESVELVGASISLLNPLVLYRDLNDNQCYMIVGIMHSKKLSSHAYEDKISADSFVITCGNELRMSVIHALMDCGELTTSELSRMLHCPVSTLLKHIDDLRSHSVIYVSRRSGLKIFYRLNLPYFENVKIKLNQLFQEIINKEKDYGREKDCSREQKNNMDNSQSPNNSL